jgi:hypothetical protein
LNNFFSAGVIITLITGNTQHDADNNQYPQGNTDPGTAKNRGLERQAVHGLAAHHAGNGFLGGWGAAIQTAALAVIISGWFAANGAAGLV